MSVKLTTQTPIFLFFTLLFRVLSLGFQPCRGLLFVFISSFYTDVEIEFAFGVLLDLIVLSSYHSCSDSGT